VNAPPRLPREHHRRNGEVTPAAFDPVPDPPEPRWLLVGFLLCTASATLVGLGLWKAAELIGDAL
jgi:hypothetical protein